MLIVDLLKAYDSVEWVYLRQILEYRWIMECVQTVSYTFSLNGEYTTPFAVPKGLIQRDPLSPCLFAIAMGGYMNCNMTRVISIILSVITKVKLTHICYADDLLLFAKGDLQSISALHSVFEHIFTGSGLKAN